MTPINSTNKDIEIKINEQQRDALNHDGDNGLVLATAGSGKTTVIISRIAKLIEEKPDVRVLTITFSKMAAVEMEERFCELYGKKYREKAKFSTIHAFAYKIVLKYFSNKGIRVELLQDRFYILNNIVKELYNKERYENVSKEEIDSISNNISYFKNMLYNPKDYKDYDISTKDFDVIFNNYEEYKKKNRLIDFDDLLIYSYKILKTNKNQRRLLKNKFDYIQVDEVQDTSKIQHYIINMISKNNVFMVGDDDQSIYSFRGSYPEFLLNFKDEFPKGKIYYLSKNYRSDKNIVEASSQIININKERYNKKIISEKNGINKVCIEAKPDKRKETEYIRRNLKINETTGVLYRYNVSAILAANLLLKENIDFYVKDNLDNFFNNNTLKDILAFFEMSKDGRNKKAFKRIYYKCNTYFTKNLAEFVINGEGNVYSRLDMYFDTNKRIDSNISRFKSNMLELSKMNIKEGIDYILREMEYIDYLFRLDDSGIINYSNTKVIIDIIKELGENIKDIEEFKIKLKELHESIKISKNKNTKVFLSTIHSAKGLEYDNVFLIDNNHGEFPRDEGKEKNYEKILEEERRIFYVGMTRAKKRLHILTSGKESLFFNELKYILKERE